MAIPDYATMGRELARRTREAQGLPLTVQDPAALDLCADIIATTRQCAEPKTQRTDT